MANTVQMFYGDYQLVPVPLISISKEYDKSGDGVMRGVRYTMSLNGTITEMDDSAGLKSLLTKKETFREAFECDGKYFRILCNEEIIFECYPRIVGQINFSNSGDNWVFTIPYSLELEFDHVPADNATSGIGEDTKLHPAFISDFQESWTIQPDEQISGGCDNIYGVRVSHSISAVGKSHFVPSGTGPNTNDGILEKQAWEQARDYIVNGDYLGFDNNIFQASGVLNLSTETQGWTPYDHNRVFEVGESDGSCSVQENWLAISSTGIRAVEDYTIQIVDGIDQEYDQVSIQGNIRGLEEKSYGTAPGDYSVDVSKYQNALERYETLKTGIYSRVTGVYGSESLGSNAVSKTLVHSCGAGLINYSWTFDNRPDPCITGAISSTIQIEEGVPTDIYAKIQIPGRSIGPIIQNFNTVSEATKTLNIEARFPPVGCAGGDPTNPSDNGDTIVSGAQAAFAEKYTQVIKTSDRGRWSPQRGLFSRTVSWIGTQC